MRKLFVLIVLVGLLLGALTVSATSLPDLTALARYYPSDSPVFAAIRTDDAYIESLDALVARIASAVPGAGVPGRLSTMLDMAAQQIDPEGDFQTVIRSWLGDTAAFGVLSLEDLGQGMMQEPPFVFALSITDRAAAEEFVSNALRRSGADFEVTTESGFTLYEVKGEEGAIAILDDVLFLAPSRNVLRPLNSAETRLNANPEFTATLGALPEDDYNIVVYVNSPALVNVLTENMPLDDEELAMTDSLMSAAAPQALGFTVLDGSALVLDSAQLAGDMSGLEELGFALPIELAPVDFGFAANVPADAPLVILGANLAATYDLVVENLRAAAALQAEAGDEEAEDFEQGLRFAEIAVRGLTGLDLRDEILGWMTGGYAVFMNINPAMLEDPVGVLPVDFGLVFEATDPAAAAQVVEGVRMAIEQSEPENVTLTQETVAGVDAAVITAEPDDSDFPVEILIGANNDVLVIGTRNAFTGVFEADGGLAADAAFTAAQNYFLPGTAMVFYLNTQPFTSIGEMLASSGDDDMQEGGLFLNALTSLVGSGSITGTWSEDGSNSRFVLSLAE